MAGFVLWFGLSRLNSSPFLGIIAIVLGSLLPDIDHPNGTIRQILELPQFLAHPVQEILPHRGPTHTIWAGFAFSALTFGLMEWGGNAILISVATAMAMLAGYASHLGLDSLNPTGVH
jgi:inner membrane protein